MGRSRSVELHVNTAVTEVVAASCLRHEGILNAEDEVDADSTTDLTHPTSLPELSLLGLCTSGSATHNASCRSAVFVRSRWSLESNQGIPAYSTPQLAGLSVSICD